MELLKEIKDKELPNSADFDVREASRIVALDDNGLIPLLFVSLLNYHKLPGGGIKSDEDRMTGLAREVLEETGCEIEVTGEIGKVIENRAKENFDLEKDLKQISYCYIGKIKSKGTPDFTAKELSQGFKLDWATLDEAIERLKNDKPKDYEGSFIVKRDLVFLNKAKEMRRAN